MAKLARIVMPLLSLVGCAGSADSDDKDDQHEDTAVADDPCPVAIVDPVALDFAALVLGTPTTETVGVLNNCSGSTTALSVQASLDGGGFSIDSTLASVAPGAVATLTVTAIVGDYASAAGSLVLVTNDPANPLVTISLLALADRDQDGDGSDAVGAGGGDCDDADATVWPGAEESWYDGVDQDCDGNDDDQDLDGFVVGEDCNDLDAAVYPGAADAWYDGVDGDCAANDDYDQDSDGYPDGEDCHDLDANVNPGAVESCDASDVDDDCDGLADDADDAVDATTLGSFYADLDGDGYGDATSVLAACDLPAGASASADDCDDARSDVQPGASEVCDALDADEDCDGLADDDDASVDPSTFGRFYADADADGYGDVASTTDACDAPGGYLADSEDCDDAAVTTNPGQTEVCADAIDEDCDGVTSCGWTVEDAARELIGEGAGDNAGTHAELAGGGDVDGDGFDEILVGAYASNRGGSGSGAAYVVSGGSALGNLNLSAAAAGLVGEHSGDALSSVSAAGDVDGDGLGDVLVGAIYNDDGGANAGKVYTLGGPVATADLSSADSEFAGGAGDYAGWDIAGNTDVDGDGSPDAIFGAPGRDSNAGGVYLVTSLTTGADLSSAMALLTGESSDDYAGRTVDAAGDLNGDGFDDFVVGAYGNDAAASNAGAAYVVLGPRSGIASLSTADAKLVGPAAGASLGFDVDGGGDVDADGYDDLLLGAYGYGSGGAAYLLTGPVIGDSEVSTVAAASIVATTTASVGLGLDIGGDADDDGYCDVLLGAYATSNYAGAAYLLLGPLSGSYTPSDADLSVTSGSTDDHLGVEVSFIGDHDGDGRDDFALGAEGEDDGGSSAGAVWVFLSSAF